MTWSRSAASRKRAPRVLLIVDGAPFASRSLVRALAGRFDSVLYSPGIEAAEQLLTRTPVTHILVCDGVGDDASRALAERIPRWRSRHRAIARVVALSRIALVKTLIPAAIDYVLDLGAQPEAIVAALGDRAR